MLGFDYGTSNCAMAVMAQGAPQIVPLGHHGKYMASSLYAPSRDIIVNWLHQSLNEPEKSIFGENRRFLLSKGQEALLDLKLDGIATDLSFGRDALAHYLDDPSEGYYIKSPKSFLGSTGLQPAQIAFFEHVVAAMMLEVKKHTETFLQREVEQVVIGRPINFQGQHGEDSNRQAMDVLTRAAKSIGFKAVEFQFEPVAAGFEYESTLDKETRVLVVDIGGGTTDCSMIRMAGEHKNAIDRSSDLLGHSGKRLGGNDFDIQLAMKEVMPNLGSQSQLVSGKPMPTSSYFDAVAINDLYRQTEFYSDKNGRFLKDLALDVVDLEQFERFLKVYRERLSYQLVNSAEQAKIQLSENSMVNIDLTYLADSLQQSVDRQAMYEATAKELALIAGLMDEAVTQAGCQPDVIFVTGGTASSPVIHDFLTQQFEQTAIIVGDHFGSVTAGLARWSEKVFR